MSRFHDRQTLSISGIRLCWELEEPKGPKGSKGPKVCERDPLDWPRCTIEDYFFRNSPRAICTGGLDPRDPLLRSGRKQGFSSDLFDERARWKDVKLSFRNDERKAGSCGSTKKCVVGIYQPTSKPDWPERFHSPEEHAWRRHGLPKSIWILLSQ